MFAHDDSPAYKTALDLAVMADEFSEQLPSGDEGRGDQMMDVTRELAAAVAKACNGTGGTTWDNVRDIVSEVAFELDMFERRAFISGVDEARALVALVLSQIP